MSFKIKLLWLVFFVFSSLQMFADNDRLSFIHYTNEDGLPSSYIKSLCQDQYGFIWAATRSSICRFDGKYFKTFQAIDEKGKSFDLWCMDFFMGTDSTLLALTTTNQLYYYDYKTEYFKKHPVLNNLGTITNLQPSSEGMWVINSDGAGLLKTGTNKLLPCTEVVNFTRLNANDKIVNIREQHGILVALTRQNNILILDLQKQLERSFHLPDDIDVSNITQFFLDQNNNAWISEEEEGIHQVNLNSGRIRNFSVKAGGNMHLLHNMVHTIEEDSQGKVWIGTENGLCVWSPYSESFDYYQYDINHPEGLNTNPVYDIFCDKEGNMWLGTYFSGINLWTNNAVFF